MDFAEKIKKARRALEKTIFDISYGTPIKRERWTQIEDGQIPTPQECAIICTILGLDQADACLQFGGKEFLEVLPKKIA